jgi:hypothetical protein
MVVSGTAALSQSPSDSSHMNLAGRGGGGLWLKMGTATSQHAHGQKELKPRVDSPPQGGQAELPGGLSDHGVEIVILDVEQETPAPPKVGQGIPMVSPLLVSPLVTACQTLS